MTSRSLIPQRSASPLAARFRRHGVARDIFISGKDQS
jgi:hypothetical protein